MKQDIPARAGDWFYKNHIYLLIIGKDANIFFVALAAKSNGYMAQCPFVPVDNNVLYNFLEDAERLGNRAPTDISHAIESWIGNNGGHKTYFELSIEDIFKTLLTGSNTDLELLSEDKLLPICFPGISGKQRDASVSYFETGGGRVGRTRLNAELN